MNGYAEIDDFPYQLFIQFERKAGVETKILSKWNIISIFPVNIAEDTQIDTDAVASEPMYQALGFPVGKEITIQRKIFQAFF